MVLEKSISLPFFNAIQIIWFFMMKFSTVHTLTFLDCFTQVEVKYDGESTGSVFDCNTWISRSSGLVKTFLGTVTNFS